MFNKHIDMRVLGVLLAGFALSGCLTLSGLYTVTVVDAEGNDLMPGVNMMAEGSGIYSIRNAMCTRHPGAIVQIRDAKTGQELRSESPYKCRGK